MFNRQQAETKEELVRKRNRLLEKHMYWDNFERITDIISVENIFRTDINLLRHKMEACQAEDLKPLQGNISMLRNYLDYCMNYRKYKDIINTEMKEIEEKINKLA